MYSIHTAFFGVCFAGVLETVITSSEWYTGAVVEYSPLHRYATESTPKYILRNALRYVSIINEAAKHKVDIIVFPEAGLTTISLPRERKNIEPYLTELPDPKQKVTPCHNEKSPQVLQELSCAARNARMYVVINLSERSRCLGEPNCPLDGAFFYNTNIVFDRYGTIIARYRKFNLFDEYNFNITSKAEYSTFETDFGVRFGMFICFDVLFSEPSVRLITEHNVTDIAYPVAWFSELPFLTALETQAGWARAFNINFLSAGYNDPSNKNGGSGIFAGKEGSLVSTMPRHRQTQLLVARVMKSTQCSNRLMRDDCISGHYGKSQLTEGITVSIDQDEVQKTKNQMNFFSDNFQPYTTKLLTNTTIHASSHSHTTSLSYKNDGITCDITVSWRGLTTQGPVYRLIAYSGKRNYGVAKTVHIEVCGLAACSNQKITSCGLVPSFTSNKIITSIEIEMTSNRELTSFPMTLDKMFHPIAGHSYTYTQIKSNAPKYHQLENMILNDPIDNLITFAIFKSSD